MPLPDNYQTTVAVVHQTNQQQIAIAIQMSTRVDQEVRHKQNAYKV